MLCPILATILVVALTERRPPRRRQGGRPGRGDDPRPRLYAPAGRPVHLIADPTPGFSRASLFDDFANSSKVDDQDRLRAMIDKGELAELEAKAPVQVLRNLAPSDAREPGRRYGVEVRILGGPHAGESWFVPESSVVRLVPKVVHPPLEVGSLAAIAVTGTRLYPRWEAQDSATRSPGTATEEGFRLDKGVKVVILEGGDAVRVRVHSGSKLTGRVGVMNQAGLRPIEPPSRPVPQKPVPAAKSSPARPIGEDIVKHRNQQCPAA